ncbi:MAG TPA: histidine kinase, partial [Candidatus Synoicihabitans sp.]|nr:histidine kinase [Candidatus Synoicihabitans sp.]
MSTAHSTDAPADAPPAHRQPPVWLLLCVWGIIVAVALLQLSLLPRLELWTWVALDWGPWLLIAPFVIWISTRVPIEQGNWRWALPLHVGLSIAVTAALGLLSIQVSPLLGPRRVWRDTLILATPLPPGDLPRAEAPGEFGHPPRSPAFWRGANDVPLGTGGRPLGPRRLSAVVYAFTRGRGQFFFYWALLAMTVAVRYQRRSVERERQALAAETRLAEARLTALQAQLQPHFLFNTLHAISSLVYSKPAAADEMICALSDLLRRVLDASAKREVTLAEEVSLAKSYVAIQQLRFDGALQVNWQIDPDLSNAAVPTLLLQPLVENAVVHALEGQGGRGAITIRVQREGERLMIEITDTGTVVTTSPSLNP